MSNIPDIPGAETVPAGPLSWLKAWLERTRLWVQTRDPATKDVGSVLDKFVDRRELVEIGLLKISNGGVVRVGDTIPTGAQGIQGIQGLPGAGVPTPDLTPPPTPTGFSVSSGIAFIAGAWDAPGYTEGHGHAKTNVYGAIWLTGDAAPTFGDVRTKLISNVVGPGVLWSYATQPATRWCLWIKWFTVDGIESTNPAGGTNGQQTTTGQDVTALLDILTGEIRLSELYWDLQRPISTTLLNFDDVATDALNASMAAYSEGKLRYTEILTEISNREASEIALSTTLEAARIAGDAATLSTANAYVSTYAYAKAATDSAIASSANTVTANFAAADSVVSASVSAESSARASLDGSVHALYTVRVQTTAGGRTVTGGFGLAATPLAAGGSEIEFGVRADRFWIGAISSASGVADILPFVVQAADDTTTTPGVTIPKGVYMDAAYIKNLTALVARLGSAWIDNAMIANLSATKLTIGDGTVGGDLKSTTFSEGSGSTPGVGWKLTAGGVLYASGAVFYGAIYAPSGRIGGNDLGADYIQSPNFVTGTTGWAIKNDGTAEFSGATMRGTLVATAGTIAGIVIAAGGCNSSDYVANTSGWAIKNDGTAEFAAATVRGQLVTSQLAADAASKSSYDSSSSYAVAMAGGVADSTDEVGSFTKDTNGSRIAMQAMPQITITLNNGFGGPPAGEYVLTIYSQMELRTSGGTLLHTFPIWRQITRVYMNSDDQYVFTSSMSSVSASLAHTGTTKLKLLTKVQINDPPHPNGGLQTGILNAVHVTAYFSTTELKR